MKNDDVELIQRVLAGDENAFSMLVRKYEKPVHALVWRKVGDFHIAEEITQDAFLQAYKELATLKKPDRFARWLSVIATRGCIAWLRKKRLSTQSLDDTSHVQLEKATYSGYVIQENEQTTAEVQREVVQKLLAKLREKERIVITLHYFGEMTHEEISDFLGTSVGTIKSRLRRAQQRLKGGESLYLMDADGSNIRRVLDNWHSRSNATWSPDGKRIASVSDAVLYIATIDGKSVEPVAQTGFESVGDPAWSPDGKEIAFIYYKSKQGYELRLLNVETLKQTVLLGELNKYPVKSDPAWSPDGAQIAFVLHKWRTILNFIDAANWQDEETIYLINRDGSNLRQLISEKGPDALHPTWSPDGNEIIYQQGIHLPEVGDIRQLFKIDVNSRMKTQLTGVGSNSGADWFVPLALPVQSKEQ